MLSDSQDRNVVSSKRVIVVLSFLLLATAFIANLFFKLTVVQYMFDSMTYIVIGGLSITGVEKFASKSDDKNKGP